MIPFLLLIILLVLIFLKVPVPVAMGVSSIAVFIVGGYPFYLLPQLLIERASNWSLLAVPFFIAAGSIMNDVGVTDRLFGFARALVGHFRGGLGYVNVLASMVFAGISGSSTADVAGLGKIEMKAMTDAGYEKKFSAGITVASCVLGPIIPPSIMFIIYGIMAETSITQLFLGGIVPGILIGGSLMVTILIMARRHPERFPPEPRKPAKELPKIFAQGFLAMIAPILILVGMTSGFVSPTEAGVVAVVYSLLLGVVYKTLNIKTLWPVIRTAMVQAAHAILLVSLGSVMGFILTFERTPYILGQYISQVFTNPLALLFVIALFVLVVGCFMSATAALIILTPILLPVVKQMGVDPVHFGVMLSFGLTIGVATPPVGVALYIMSDIANMKLEDVVRGVAPFLVPLFISLLLITFFPQLTLWLPRLLR